MKRFFSFGAVLAGFVLLLSACTPQALNIDTSSFLDGTEDQVQQIADDLNKQIEEQVNQQIEDKLVSGGFEMLPEDCVEGEQYDPVEKVCFYECSSDAECAQIEEQILAALDEIGSDFFEGDLDFQEAEPPKPIDENANNTEPVGEESDQIDAQSLVEYDVSGDVLSNPRKGNPQSPEDEAFLNDQEKHRQLWEYFTSLFPVEFRSQVNEFALFSDGRSGTYAAVYQDESDPAKWTLALDYQDSFEGNEFNRKELPYTLIHEFGHLLTLNKTQIDLQPFTFQVPAGKTQEQVLDEAAASCAPRYYLQEGCTKENSTINQFYQRFWTGIIDEKNQIEEIEDEEQYAIQSQNFYEKYQDQFVTDYATTNVAEDIAESWTAFILKERPQNPQTIADQKVAFFYEYPTLVNLQQYIRARLR